MKVKDMELDILGTKWRVVSRNKQEDKQLENLAAENCISLNQLVNQCIEFALDHRTEAEEKAHA